MRFKYARHILLTGVILLVFLLAGCSWIRPNESRNPVDGPTEPTPPIPPVPGPTPTTFEECIKNISPEASPATRRAEEIECEKL